MLYLQNIIVLWGKRETASGQRKGREQYLEPKYLRSLIMGPLFLCPQYKCECSTIGRCQTPGSTCNCDGTVADQASDFGRISRKDRLPIKKIM